MAAGATFAGILFRAIASLATVRLCLNFLGKEAFAVWVFVQNASGYFALSEAGVGQATLNEQGLAYGEKNFERMSRVLVSATGLYIFLVSIAAIVAFGVLLFFPLQSWLPEEIPMALRNEVGVLLGTAVTLVLCAVPLTSFGATLSGARFHHVRQILDAFLPLFVVSTLAAVLVAGGGLKAAVIITPLSQIAWGAVYFFAVRKNLPELKMHPKFFSWPIARTMLAHSMFFFLIGFCLLGFRSLPTLLVGRHGTVDDVSRVYALVLLIRILGWSIMDAISRVVQPYIILFKHQGEWVRVLFFTRLGTVVTGLGALLLVLFVLCFGEGILTLWLHEPVSLARGLVEVLCFSFLFDIALLPVFNTLVALNRHRRLGLLMAIQSVLMIVFAEVGVRSGFWVDPATAVLSGVLFASVFAFFAASALIAAPGLEVSGRVFVRSILAPQLSYVAFALAATAFLLLDRGFGADSKSSFLPITIFAGFSGLAIALTWKLILGHDERQFLRSFLERRRS